MADAAAVTEAGAAIALHYRVWRTDFRVTVASPAIAGYVQLLCGQFGTKPARDAVELEVAAGPGGWIIHQGGERAVLRRTEQGAARHIEWRLVGIAARAERRLIHWHAAALVRGEHTLLLPGKSGVGKSTLALALSLQGFELLGEDVVFMDADNGVIHPFPRAPRVDDASLGRLEGLGLEYDPAKRVGNLLPVSVVPAWRTLPSRPLSHVLLVEWDEQGPVEGGADHPGGGGGRAAGALAHPETRARGSLATPAACARAGALLPSSTQRGSRSGRASDPPACRRRRPSGVVAPPEPLRAHDWPCLDEGSQRAVGSAGWRPSSAALSGERGYHVARHRGSDGRPVNPGRLSTALARHGGSSRARALAYAAGDRVPMSRRSALRVPACALAAAVLLVACDDARHRLRDRRAPRPRGHALSRCRGPGARAWSPHPHPAGAANAGVLRRWATCDRQAHCPGALSRSIQTQLGFVSDVIRARLSR